jgi:hypothetical protein
MKKINAVLLFAAGLSLLAVSCGELKQGDGQRLTSGKGIISEGEELFKMHCITCHSLRYIEMQPAFTRKTWEKITDKMIRNFGAPVPDSSAKKIVDFLVTLKGGNEN